ncbi:hypothetical protein PR048_009816 [Dryococelus australis]|uniref:Uncharacterized protein n=1 Tax=Dryococelus australis TaxID=614101 RepID=A0ABQ9I0Y3_9NEOP|nr:hypothetical protein PR048_009816 [Dryococelus australis]
MLAACARELWPTQPVLGFCKSTSRLDFGRLHFSIDFRYVFNPRLGHSGFSHVGIVPDDVGRRVFSGISRFPRPRNGSQDLYVKSRPNLSTPLQHEETVPPCYSNACLYRDKPIRTGASPLFLGEWNYLGNRFKNVLVIALALPRRDSGNSHDGLPSIQFGVWSLAVPEKRRVTTTVANGSEICWTASIGTAKGVTVSEYARGDPAWVASGRLTATPNCLDRGSKSLPLRGAEAVEGGVDYNSCSGHYVVFSQTEANTGLSDKHSPDTDSANQEHGHPDTPTKVHSSSTFVGRRIDGRTETSCRTVGKSSSRHCKSSIRAGAHEPIKSLSVSKPISVSTPTCEETALHTPTISVLGRERRTSNAEKEPLSRDATTNNASRTSDHLFMRTDTGVLSRGPPTSRRRAGGRPDVRVVSTRTSDIGAGIVTYFIGACKPALTLVLCSPKCISRQSSLGVAATGGRTPTPRAAASAVGRRNILEVELQQGFRKGRKYRESIIRDFNAILACLDSQHFNARLLSRLVSLTATYLTSWVSSTNGPDFDTCLRHRSGIWVDFNVKVLRADEGEARRVWIIGGRQGRRKREIPEKEKKPPTSGTIPTRECPGATPPGTRTSFIQGRKRVVRPLHHRAPLVYCVFPFSVEKKKTRDCSLDPAQLDEEHCTLARAGNEHLYAKTQLGKVKEAAGIAERRMEGARVCEAELVANSSHQTALGRASLQYSLALGSARLKYDGVKHANPSALTSGAGWDEGPTPCKYEVPLKFPGSRTSVIRSCSSETSRQPGGIRNASKHSKFLFRNTCSFGACTEVSRHLSPDVSEATPWADTGEALPLEQAAAKFLDCKRFCQLGHLGNQGERMKHGGLSARADWLRPRTRRDNKRGARVGSGVLFSCGSRVEDGSSGSEQPAQLCRLDWSSADVRKLLSSAAISGE